MLHGDEWVTHFEHVSFKDFGATCKPAVVFRQPRQRCSSSPPAVPRPQLKHSGFPKWCRSSYWKTLVSSYYTPETHRHTHRKLSGILRKPNQVKSSFQVQSCTFWSVGRWHYFIARCFYVDLLLFHTCVSYLHWSKWSNTSWFPAKVATRD